MPNINEILQACAGKMETKNDGGRIGFRHYNQSTWHWFTLTYDKTEILDFDHSYSMDTGFSKRGNMHEVTTRRHIEKTIGLPLNDTFPG